MVNELNYDLTSWWSEQSFPGKELFKISEIGALSINNCHFIKEHNIAYLSIDTADVVLKNLQEKFFSVDGKMRELEVEWLASEDKLKLADKIEHLKDWMQHQNAVGDFEKYMLVIADWDKALQNLSTETMAAKTLIVEMAEKLADSDNWKETTQAFKDIAEKWKTSGALDKSRNDKLYARIEVARKKFQDRKRRFHEEEEKDMNNNLDLKLEVVEQAEKLAGSEEWKNTTEAFHKLMDKWKAIGRAPHHKNEELWQRLQAARNTFFDRKKTYYHEVQSEQEANYALKLALVEKAESLRESTEWNATSQAFAGIMEEWKKIGKVQYEKSDEIWNRLNAAADQFFEAKKKRQENVKQELDANYVLKSELLARAEELKHSSHFHDATAEFQELMDEWKKIGPVAREHSNTMWEAFLDARKTFFARKDADREKRKTQIEQRNVAKVEEAKHKLVKLREDIKDEEQKLIDFANALDNITPGKKAAQLKDHLEKLIVETKDNIVKMKDKLAHCEKTGQPAEAREKN